MTRNTSEVCIGEQRVLESEAEIILAWRSAGTTHFWCSKCKKQVPADSELVFKEGKVLWKWKCSTCGTDYMTDA